MLKKSIKDIADIIIRGKKNIVFPLTNANGWIHDAQNTHLLDVRGWGHFQYATNDKKEDEFGTKGAEIQDAFGDWVVATLNAEFEKEQQCQHPCFMPCSDGICTSDVHTHHCTGCGKHVTVSVKIEKKPSHHCRMNTTGSCYDCGKIMI